MSESRTRAFTIGLRLAAVFIGCAAAFACALAIAAINFPDTHNATLLAALSLPMLVGIWVALASIYITPKPEKARVRSAHSVFGLCIAFVVYFVGLSGCFALFADEFRLWENPEWRLNGTKEKTVELQPILQELLDEATGFGAVQSVGVRYPQAADPFFSLSVSVQNSNSQSKNFSLILSAEGSSTKRPIDGLSAWLRGLHNNYGVRKTAGRPVAGAVGLLLLTTALLGFLTQKHFFSSLFVWRLNAPATMRMRDTHQVLAGWAMLFIILMAYSGASLAFLKSTTPKISTLASGGPVTINEMRGAPALRSGEAAGMMSIDSLTRLAADYAQGDKLQSIRIEPWGDQDAQATIYWRDGNALTYTSLMRLDATSGALLEKRPTLIPGFIGRIEGALMPLHLAAIKDGWFGKFILKTIYCLLGLTLCGVSVSGVLYWLSRRKLESHKKDYLSLGAAGIFCGLPAAITTTVLAAKIMNVAGIFSAAVFPAVFLSVWFFVAAATFFCARAVAVMRRAAFVIAGSSLVSVVLSVTQATGLFCDEGAPYGAAVAGVDAVLAMICLLSSVLLFSKKKKEAT